MSSEPAGCVLFTDLVGFTEYTAAVGDTKAAEVLDQQATLAAQVIDPQRGDRIVKELGDGLMCWFPDPAVALAAAAELTRLVAAARRDDSFPLAMRLGLHWGEVHHRGDDLVGHIVNVAARICDLAGPSELLISEEALGAARAHAGPGRKVPATTEVGPALVKGVERPVWLHRVS